MKSAKVLVVTLYIYMVLILIFIYSTVHTLKLADYSKDSTSPRLYLSAISLIS